MQDVHSEAPTTGYDPTSESDKVVSALGKVEEEDEEIFTMVAATAEAEGLDPTTLEEARSRTDWAKWEDAIKAELKSLEDARTWDIEECPDGANVMGCKWVFKIKRNAAGEIDKYKAHLVAKGHTQVLRVDYYDTYAPVARLASLCTILTIAARNDWDVDVFDFHSAFLNGKLDDDELIYMQLPPGYNVAGEWKTPVAQL